MEKCRIVFILLWSNFILIAQNKAIVPRTGTIVFVKKDSIDSKLYSQSYKNLKPKIKKAFQEQTYLERLTDGKTTDTLKLNKMADDFVNLYQFVITEKEDRILKYYCKYENDKIIKHLEVDGIEYKMTNIDTKTNDITDQNNQHIDYHALQSDIKKLKEFRDETKLINGYKCFKVVYQYTKEFDSEFDIIGTVITNKKELWVTDAIKSLYHPVINDFEILEKYYPLQIIEYSDELKGFQTNYTVETITLK